MIAKAIAALHAILDGRPLGADEALAAAESEVSPLFRARFQTARAMLARAPLPQPLDERLPPGLRRVWTAAASASARGAPREAREELSQALARCEPHLSFYAQHTSALLQAILERSP